MEKVKKDCNNCRYRQTGWDGGFFGLPMTCECYHFGNVENRKNCQKFKRPYPKGFELLSEFKKWFNDEYMSELISYEDLLKFKNEWK